MLNKTPGSARAVARPAFGGYFLGHFEQLADRKCRLTRTTVGDYFGNGASSVDPVAPRVEWIRGPCKERGRLGPRF